MKGEGIRVSEVPKGSSVWVAEPGGTHVLVPTEVLDALENFTRRALEAYQAPLQFPSALYVLQWMRKHGWARDVDEWEADADPKYDEWGAP